MAKQAETKTKRRKVEAEIKKLKRETSRVHGLIGKIEDELKKPPKPKPKKKKKAKKKPKKKKRKTRSDKGKKRKKK